MYLKSINLHIESWLFEEDNDNNDDRDDCTKFLDSETDGKILIYNIIVVSRMIYLDFLHIWII